MTTFPPRAPRYRGFSLVELVLVIVILSVAAVAILGQFTQVSSSLNLNETVQTAGQLVQEKAEQILAEARAGQFSTIVTTAPQNLTGNYAGYTRSVTVNGYAGTACPSGATCKQVLVDVGRGGSKDAEVALLLVN
ncbi:MAG: type II secretion system protein [Gammaproteobacteria bacterium]